MKTICIVGAMLLLTALAAVGSVSAADWTDDWVLGALPEPGSQDPAIVTYGYVGVDQNALDGYDALDQMLVMNRPAAYCATYHINGAASWTGETGFYAEDVRHPLGLVLGNSHTWTIYFWADPTLSSSETAMVFNVRALSWSQPPQIDSWLTLVSKPTGVSGGPPAGTRWHISQDLADGFALPVFRTTNGLDGYVFTITSTVLPEPSSLLALGIGLLPLGLVLIRKHR